ncbi:PREDICTED: uncharacterized protein LOC100634094 [Amphimedon queenslandica]|nr:PREDICTED: uncharacterized protein LOC100634094 [Amphimedon queenslandica]|eukprot:XP_019863786.1 PREDICTED: uncharacterized protein LOC100634094 [Amphimedon queenslandica]
MESLGATNELNILHITDVHNSTEMVAAVSQWVIKHKEKIDIILLSGDIADMPMEYGNDTTKEALLFKGSYYQDLQQVVSNARAICDRVYYVPGNHDPPQSFNEASPEITIDPIPSCNVHLHTIPVAPGLFLSGLGGSVPGYQDGKQCWDGFPYNNEDDINKDLTQLLEPFLGKDTPLRSPEDQLILMTHCGPSNSSTSRFCDDPNAVIEAGSMSLYNWLVKPELQRRVLLNVHGHIHHGYGEAHVGMISVLNPGPLLDGHFSLYTLTRKGDPLQWSLSAVRRYVL